MASILAIERFLPPFRYEQEEVTGWVEEWLRGYDDSARLISVYKGAGVKRRASVVPIEEVFRPGDFETQNDRYAAIAREAGIALARGALDQAEIAPGEVDAVFSVSCTGFMIPALDAYVADALGMGPRLVRLPITESGCAGGVVGLARAHDYLTAHPRAVALVIALELASLTFQRWDRSGANVVSTAIFGDGGAAVVLAGPEHPRARRLNTARVTRAGSIFFPGTTHLMGFRLKNAGLQIVLDRELAPFVRREVVGAVGRFLDDCGLARPDVSRWILHPGGRRIIAVMSERLGLGEADR